MRYICILDIDNMIWWGCLYIWTCMGSVFAISSLSSIQSTYFHVQHNQVLLGLRWFLQFIGLFIEIAWFVQHCCIDAQPSNFSFNSWPDQQTLTMINRIEYCKLRIVDLLNNHTSYLSILVHRRIIEVYKKYTKKLSELATK